MLLVASGLKVSRETFQADLDWFWNPDRNAYGFHDLRARRFGVGVEQRLRADDHPRRAVAALVAGVIDERLLDRLQPVALGEALDGRHALARHRLEGGSAGAHRLAVDEHGTGPARGDATAELGAGEPQVVAKHPQQAAIGIGGQGADDAIQREGGAGHVRDLAGIACSSLVREALDVKDNYRGLGCE